MSYGQNIESFKSLTRPTVYLSPTIQNDMEVDFNSLRKNIIRDFNKLVKQVRNPDLVDEQSYENLQKTLSDLRRGIVVIGCIFDDEHGIISLADEEYLVP